MKELTEKMAIDIFNLNEVHSADGHSAVLITRMILDLTFLYL